MRRQLSQPAWILFALVVTLPVLGRNYLTRQQALDLYFQPETVQKASRLIRSDTMEALAKQVGKPDSRIFVFYSGKLKEGGKTGYAVFGKAMGKLMPFSFMLVSDDTFAIVAVEILSYAESHGSEVRHPKFRAQFKGKTVGDPIELHDDIRNVAGATISCTSLTREVRKQLVLLTTLVGREAGSGAPAADLHPAGLPPVTEDDTLSGHRIVRTQALMGTLLTITLDHRSDRPEAESALTRAFRTVRELEHVFSRYLPDSELNRLNGLAPGTVVAVSPHMARLLTVAEQVRIKSNGRFDINYRKPGPRPAYRVDSPGNLKVLAPLDLDTGAIAKGYAMDRVAELLVQAGFRHALLNFGGQLLAVDRPLGERAWPVTFRYSDRPVDSAPDLLLATGSLATSGDDQRGRWMNGRPVSHIANGRTGVPVQSNCRAVSVFHPSATLADAWSTVCYTLDTPPDERLAFMAGHGLGGAVWDQAGTCRRIGI